MPFDSTTYAPAQVDDVGQIILKARALLSDPSKWTKGEYCSGASFCVLGAIGYSDQRGSDDPTAKQEDAAIRIARLLDPVDDDYVEVIATFNDAPSTTHADIMDLLARAAKPGDLT